MSRLESIDGSLALVSPRVITIPANTSAQARKLRVAAYARVSSNSEDQLNSFAAQNAHYTELITSNPDWEFVDVYADKGITGTSAEKRDDFQRLLADCRRGRIDKILVKSSSRFARNAKECLEAIRELKTLDVSVCFEEQNIDTAELSGELLVAIFAMMDQKESETISQNIRWSVDARMRTGKYNTCHAPFGYRLSNGKLELLPESLPIIQYIFHAYLSGNTASEIASALIRLTKDHTWNPQKVDYILTNERYCGNALLRKRFATDTLPRKKQRNVPCILSRKSTKQPSHLKYLKEQKRCGYLETKNSCLELRDNVLLRMDLLSVDAVDAFCAQSALMEYGIWFAGDMKKIQVDVIYPQFLKKLY